MVLPRTAAAALHAFSTLALNVPPRADVELRDTPPEFICIRSPADLAPGRNAFGIVSEDARSRPLGPMYSLKDFRAYARTNPRRGFSRCAAGIYAGAPPR